MVTSHPSKNWPVTGASHPQAQVNDTFPLEHTCTAATKLSGLRDKRHLNLHISFAALYHSVCIGYFQKKLEMSWNPQEDLIIILLHKILPNYLPNVWGDSTHLKIAPFSEGHFMKYMACKASLTPEGKEKNALSCVWGETFYVFLHQSYMKHLLYLGNYLEAEENTGIDGIVCFWKTTLAMTRKGELNLKSRRGPGAAQTVLCWCHLSDQPHLLPPLNSLLHWK